MLDRTRQNKPFYAFLFFDAPHGPYSYPDNFEKFKPSNKNPNYVTTSRKDAVALRNSYKNAICFDDTLIGSLLDTVRKKGLLENSIIIITADHGEEFYETGFWGHTSAFSRYQTQVR
jgi:membrane-anchored protein YejM (alkaline phosphatase superfamily)